MSVNNFKYIHFVHYKDIPNWSVQYVVEEKLGFTKKYLMAKIGSFLKKSKNLIEIQDDAEYRQVTVKINNGGVIARNGGQLKRGSEIGTKRQTIVHAGQFIVSKIDARNGAFGVIPDDLEGAIVTNDFPVFDVDSSKILPQFMVLISTTPQFVEFARKCSSGTTNRKRIDIDAFLQQVIPLPSLKEQIQIVREYNSQICQYKSLENRNKALKDEINTFMKNELRISKKENSNNISGLLNFVHYSKVREWGCSFIRNNSNHGVETPFNVLKIKAICSVGSGGTPSRTNASYYKGIYPWVKTGEVLNDVIFETEEKISLEAIERSSAKLYPKGSLLMAMYGQGDTRGRTAKLGVDATTNQACAVLFNIKNNVVLTDYLWFYLQMQYDDIRALASGNNQPNLNIEKIKNYEVVVPPLSVQETIVYRVMVLKNKIKDNLKMAIVKKQKAETNFEQTIFE